MTLRRSQYHRLAIGVLIVMVLTVIAGVTVRLTGSGLGCEDWPNCSDTHVIDVSSSHARIEQLNRLFTVVTTISAIAAVVGAWLLKVGRRDLTIWSAVLLVSVVANAVLGGISVLVDLHPIAVQFHLILALVAVAAATVLVRRSEPDRSPVPDGDVRPSRVDVGPTWLRPAIWVHYTLTWVAVFTGTLVTGAGPHAGDPSSPRLNVEIESVARVHSLAVLITITTAILIAYALRRQSARSAGVDRMRSDLSAWIVLGVLQAVVGYVQYFNGVPVLLVGVHVFGATMVVWSATRLVLDTTNSSLTSSEDSESNLELATTDRLE